MSDAQFQWRHVGEEVEVNMRIQRKLLEELPANQFVNIGLKMAKDGGIIVGFYGQEEDVSDDTFEKYRLRVLEEMDAES